jgi:hypothetical protein
LRRIGAQIAFGCYIFPVGSRFVISLVSGHRPQL